MQFPSNMSVDEGASDCKVTLHARNLMVFDATKLALVQMLCSVIAKSYKKLYCTECMQWMLNIDLHKDGQVT